MVSNSPVQGPRSHFLEERKQLIGRSIILPDRHFLEPVLNPSPQVLEQDENVVGENAKHK